MVNCVKNKLGLSDQIIEVLKDKEVFSSFETHFVSGKNKRPASEKLILVNTLFAMEDDETKEIEGYININIQDSDTVWIEYIGELIQLYIDQSIITGFKLDFVTEHLFKVSQDLFFKNLKFHFTSL